MPAAFSSVQAAVRLVLCVGVAATLLAYGAAMGGTAPDTAHFWVMSLLLLLLGLNDPLYAACLARGGDLTLQAASAWAEACFSALLLLFWLAHADSMSSSRGGESVAPLGCSAFWAPKLLAAGVFFLFAAPPPFGRTEPDSLLAL